VLEVGKVTGGWEKLGGNVGRLDRWLARDD
jgi:hypothetical protein